MIVVSETLLRSVEFLTYCFECMKVVPLRGNVSNWIYRPVESDYGAVQEDFLVLFGVKPNRVLWLQLFYQVEIDISFMNASLLMTSGFD